MIDKFIDKLSRKQILVFFWIFWMLSYGVMGGVNAFRDTYELSMMVDQFVPLWTPAVVGYLIFYPFIFLTFVFIKKGDLMKRGLKAFIYVALITNLFFIFFPTSMAKPSFEVVSTFDWIVDFLYSADTPANAFPSQHVAYTALCSILYSKHFKGKWLGFLLLFLVITISTMLIKQHYVWDAIAGFLIGLGAYYLAFDKKRV